MNKPVISFEKYEIININYTKSDDFENKEPEINTQVSAGITEEKDAGKIEITVNVSDPDCNRIITVQVRGFFLINEESEMEQREMYLAQNGTAILYPYVRSIISMISSLDCESAILIPTVNTQKTNEEE